MVLENRKAQEGEAKRRRNSHSLSVVNPFLAWSHKVFQAIEQPPVIVPSPMLATRLVDRMPLPQLSKLSAVCMQTSCYASLLGSGACFITRSTYSSSDRPVPIQTIQPSQPASLPPHRSFRRTPASLGLWCPRPDYLHVRSAVSPSWGLGPVCWDALKA